jgi:glycosyltransferase involved in cell wall biosynthesis
MSNNIRKPVIAMDLSTQGKGGGPYTSTTRIMNSSLKEQYEFAVIYYDPTIGKSISLKRILHLRSQIKEIAPDIVHFTGLSLQGFHLSIACLLAGVERTVVSIRGTSSDAIYFNPLKRFLLAKLLEPITLLIATKIVGVSNYVSSEKVSQTFHKKLYGTIYNFPPIVFPEFDKINYREKLGLPLDSIIISSVGRITKEKGYHILEEAITYFKNQSKVKFIIVGEGEYLTTMRSNLYEQVSSGQVIFLGYSADAQNINFAADIFVLPTLHETLSNALLEASKAGLALVASDTGGVPEIVETGYNGELVPTGEPWALMQAIQKLVADPKLIREYGDNALIKVNSKFSADTIETKLEQLYSQLLSK